MFYYVLSEGGHPFGDALRRQANILTDERNLEELKGAPWRVALQKPLIAQLISSRPQSRPPSNAVLSHPMFWNNGTVLSFLQVSYLSVSLFLPVIAFIKHFLLFKDAYFSSAGGVSYGFGLFLLKKMC